MTFELPLFPLNVVLFPGMALPLHIFEPRYRLMLRRCLESDRTFGVCLLIAGQEGEPGTLPAPVGCTAEIAEVLEFEDGRMNLQSIGRRRFRIESLREEDDYLIGQVEWLDDDDDFQNPPEAQTVRAALRNYLRALAQSTGLSEFSPDDLDIPTDAYALSMLAASLLNVPSEQKQELLEITSTRARLEFEKAWLQRSEIIQRAFLRRAETFPPAPPDESLGPFAHFVSPN